MPLNNGLITVDGFLRAFERATAGQREQIISGLVDRVTEAEAGTLDRLLLWRQKRLDLFGSLPVEIQLYVVDYLDAEDLCASTLVCRRWQAQFLDSEPIVNYLLSKWLTLHDDVPSEEKAQVLLQGLRKRSFRATGRFRSRLMSTFGVPVGGRPPVGRLEQLQHGSTYMNVIRDGASIGQQEDARPELPWPKRTIYVDGHLAYQLHGPPPAVSPITVHNLYTWEQRQFTRPGQFARGSPVRLLDLGNELVVASSSRTMIAWTLIGESVHEVSLPRHPVSCLTRDRSILIETEDHELYFWESLSRLIAVDTTLPACDEALFGLSPPRMLQSLRFDFCSLPAILHPRDSTRFFVVHLAPSSSGLLMLYEFKPAGKQYAISQSYKFDINKLPGVPGVEIFSPVVDVRKADGRGTFQLLKIFWIGNASIPHRYQCVMFNVFTTKFTVEQYQTPPGSLWQLPTRQLNSVSCLWRGQLIQPYSDPTAGQYEHFPLLFAFDQSNITDTPEPPTGSQLWTALKDVLGEASDLEERPSTARPDIIRLRDLVTQDLSVPNYHSFYGFKYACYLHPKAGMCAGCQLPFCWLCRLASLQLEDFHTIQSRSERQLPGQPQGSVATEIHADDDFLVYVTGSNTYFVFCVDADGKWAEMIKAKRQDSMWKAAAASELVRVIDSHLNRRPYR